ncbi:hypothetical protein [Paraburkholderia domus]|uniref:hypothetical protein n=1 Tax=Paraburkholderia domus TaxID=2793075 RepID=UPI001913CE8F|nr:hypothetical protein [Paraburkholderia domus]MBK5180452.1 hypothetical protein [Burkholderia sp. R-69749]CAE6801928.1 hypothetical protein R69749_02660 [Paraburkholderia domus]
MQNPITTPRGFFDGVVAPDVADLRENVQDVRLAFHAAISIHQLPEWIFKAGLTQHVELSQYRDSLYALRPDLKIIRDIASNAKHFPPERATPLNIGTSAGPALSFPDTPFFEPTQKQVLAKDEQGGSQWVIPVILAAFDFWSKEMTQYLS